MCGKGISKRLKLVCFKKNYCSISYPKIDKMQHNTNFNNIAPFYDGLSRLIFGKKIKNAQVAALHFIPPNATVLIVGGGTGWILNEINNIHLTGLKITYLDKSLKMIELTKQRSFVLNDITYLHNSIETADLQNQKYDVILTPFVLDCIAENSLPTVFRKLDACLKTDGLWLYIDFVSTPNSKQWQKLTLKLIYLFFRLTCRLEVSTLISVAQYFTQYQLLKENTYISNFIKMSVYKK